MNSELDNQSLESDETTPPNQFKSQM